MFIKDYSDFRKVFFDAFRENILPVLRVVVFLLYPYFLFSQTDTAREYESSMPEAEQVVEDIVSSTEVEEQVDFSFLTDVLEEYLRKPLNLNTASRAQLQLLPGMTDLHISQLFGYMEKFGALTSIFELQAVPGLRIEEIRPWLPFITVKEVGEKDIRKDSHHPAGPAPKDILRGLSYEFTHRITFVMEPQKGYFSEDTQSRPYEGSPMRHYSRFRARYGRNVSMAMVGEKDPGETFSWRPEKRLYGYDFLSGHLSIGNFGNLKRLLIGDYNLAVGQGLVLSRGVGFGKGAEVISNVKMPGKGVLPYSSVNENQFMRGAAATVAWKHIHLTGFYSRVGQDAVIQSDDTLAADELQVSSLRTSGLHRTEAEIAGKRALKETGYGGRLEYKSRTLTVGTTFYSQEFAGEINRRINEYNQFDFRGNHNFLYSVDIDRVYQNFNFFGEIARSRSGGMAGVVGLMSSLAPTVDVSVVARRFAKDFHSNKGYAFAERPTAIQNETGIYLGIQIMPHTRWKLCAYMDQFYFPWNRFGVDYPSRGWEFLAQLEYKPNRKTQAYIRFRSDNKEINASQYPEGQQVTYIVPTNKTQLRLHFQTGINRDITYRTRMEFAWFRQEGEAGSNGMMLYQDLIWKLGYKWKLTGRYALFDAPDYRARIYAYENDILGFFSIPPYYQIGSRYYLMANWKPVRRMDFWLRISQTRLYKADTFGSGLEQINGPSRTDVRLQVRVKI